MHGRPWVVGIRDTHERVVSRIGPGQGVRWGRAAGVGQGCYVEPHPVTPDWHYWYPDLRPDADLSHWLCNFWGMRELAHALVAFFASAERDSALSQPPAPVGTESPEPIDPELLRCQREQYAARASKPTGVAGIGEVVPVVPSLNGKAKHH